MRRDRHALSSSSCIRSFGKRKLIATVSGLGSLISEKITHKYIRAQVILLTFAPEIAFLVNVYKTMLALMDKSSPYLSLRMSPEEMARYEAVIEKVSNRYPGKIVRSDLIREIIGLSPPAWLTPEEILFFRTGTKDTETRATFHNAEQVEFPQKKLKVSDDRRDESKVSKPRKRGGQR